MGKSDADTDLTTDLIKNASDIWIGHLVLAIRSLFTHGYVLKNILNIKMIPLVKDALKNLNSSDDYRSKLAN